MNGQWVGQYKGTSSGTIVVNIDSLESCYGGVAYVLDSDAKAPSIAVSFRTQNKGLNAKLRVQDILPINPNTGDVVPWETLKDSYSGWILPKYADVEMTLAADQLSISWVTDIGSAGSCILPKSKAGLASELIPLDLTWRQFEEYLSTLKLERPIFRGQKRTYRLRTSFHRSGRADVHRFLVHDRLMLYRHLSARTKHIFNLGNPEENGAFFNLIQHHGYPTPLLDWSYSPYVAAFFAYREVTTDFIKQAGLDSKVRILIFDQHQWQLDMTQFPILACPWPNFTICEFVAIENERLIPQQSVSTVTSMDDIEGYIHLYESQAKKYLYAIDLPTNERNDVMRNLRIMGITAGSMFPGLDGACEELRERNFTR